MATTIPSAPSLGSYTDATGSVSSHCGCRVSTMPRGVVVVVPYEGHAAAVVVEMRPREVRSTADDIAAVAAERVKRYLEGNHARGG